MSECSDAFLASPRVVMCLHSPGSQLFRTFSSRAILPAALACTAFSIDALLWRAACS